MSAAFTPGPWSLEGSAMGCRSVTSGELLIACVEDAPGEANAHLIAASPDLYADLETIVKANGGTPFFAAAALAKARGEQ